MRSTPEGPSIVEAESHLDPDRKRMDLQVCVCQAEWKRRADHAGKARRHVRERERVAGRTAKGLVDHAGCAERNAEDSRRNGSDRGRAVIGSSTD
jgi:hypothetical protein